MNHFSIRLWHATKSGFYTTASNDQLSGWAKKKLQSTSQSQTCTQKRSWSLFGGLLPIWSTTAFWILVTPLHLRSTLSKSVRCTENCNACSQHRSTEKARFFSTTMPDCMSHNQHFKSWMNWAMKFGLIHPLHLTSCQPTTASWNILTMFCRENPSTTRRRQKMLSRVHWILKHAFSPHRNKQTRFSLEKCVDCNGLFNKDVLEPSYNNLKFIVWNHSYFCTNLITGLINKFLLFFSKFFRNLRPSSSLLLTLGFPGGSVNKICIAGRFQSLGLEDPLEKEMATHSSILAWKTPWTVEPGRL